MDNVQRIVLLWGSVTWKVQILARQATCSVLMCFRRWWGNVVGHDTSPGPDPAPCIINRRDLTYLQCCVLHKNRSCTNPCARHRMVSMHCVREESKCLCWSLGFIQVAASSFAPDSPYCQPPCTYFSVFHKTSEGHL